MVHDAQRCQGCIVVGERLSLSHYHDVGHAHIVIILYNVDLIDKLTRHEASRKACLSGCAKHTSHGAAGLARNADSQAAVRGGEPNCFYKGAIMKF